MEKENQFTIIEEATGKVLYCKKDDDVSEGQIAITEMCTLPNPDFKEIFFNFETQEFYIKE
jgi:5,10-methenyltetrahydromethanopterin hydrogenase